MKKLLFVSITSLFAVSLAPIVSADVITNDEVDLSIFGDTNKITETDENEPIVITDETAPQEAIDSTVTLISGDSEGCLEGELGEHNLACESTSETEEKKPDSLNAELPVEKKELNVNLDEGFDF